MTEVYCRINVLYEREPKMFLLGEHFRANFSWWPALLFIHFF
jgi:hypothetical protein